MSTRSCLSAGFNRHSVLNPWSGQVGIDSYQGRRGVVNFRRYDPMTGTDDWVTSDEAREVDAAAADVTTFRVTA